MDTFNLITPAEAKDGMRRKRRNRRGRDIALQVLAEVTRRELYLREKREGEKVRKSWTKGA